MSTGGRIGFEHCLSVLGICFASDFGFMGAAKCAAEVYFAAPENWIQPAAVNQVVLEPGHGPFFEPRPGILNVATCRHVLAVKQPLPEGIEFFDNAEFDNCDGRQISGDNLLDVIKRLNQPFCPVLDAAYQFAVSIGIYIRRSNEQRQDKQAA